MGEVVDICSRQPHLSGKAVCLNCNVHWEAVAEIGTTCLECPTCECAKGVFWAIVAPSNYWQCGCGNSMFMVNMEGVHCTLCGLVQVFP